MATKDYQDARDLLDEAEAAEAILRDAGIEGDSLEDLAQASLEKAGALEEQIEEARAALAEALNVDLPIVGVGPKLADLVEAAVAKIAALEEQIEEHAA